MAAPLPILATALPSTLSNINLEQIIPNISKLKSLSSQETEYVYVGDPEQCIRVMGRQHIRKCVMNKYKLERIHLSQMPNPNVVFFFVNNQWRYDDKFIDTFAKKSPCIGHIYNQCLLCDKGMMVKTLLSYYRDDVNRVFQSIIPKSYVIRFDYLNHKFIFDQPEFIQDIHSTQIDKYDAWICKSSYGSQGKNVFVFLGNNLDDLQDFLLERVNPYAWLDYAAQKEMEMTLVISKYIKYPLLYKNKFKNDLRVYILIAKTNPCIVYFHVGKIRLSAVEYNLKDLHKRSAIDPMTGECLEQSFGHITNAACQKLHNEFDLQQYTVQGNDIVLNWPEFVLWLYEHSKEHFPDQWFEQYDRDKITLAECDDLVREKLKRLVGLSMDSVVQEFDDKTEQLKRPGQFAFWGGDIILDKYGQPWVLEFNRQPLLSLSGTPTVKRMMEELLEEMVDIVMDIRTKRLAGINVKTHSEVMPTKHWEPVILNHYQNKNKNNKSNKNVSISDDDLKCENI